MGLNDGVETVESAIKMDIEGKGEVANRVDIFIQVADSDNDKKSSQSVIVPPRTYLNDPQKVKDLLVSIILLFLVVLAIVTISYKWAGLNHLLDRILYESTEISLGNTMKVKLSPSVLSPSQIKLSTKDGLYALPKILKLSMLILIKGMVRNPSPLRRSLILIYRTDSLEINQNFIVFQLT